MHAETHARFAERGQPLSASEKQRLERLVACDNSSEPCHELLCSILHSKMWIEQERFAEELLLHALT